MWSAEDMIEAFDASVPLLVDLATDEEKVQWFNQGQARFRRPTTMEIEWSQGDREIILPNDFLAVDKLLPDEGVTPQPWNVFGRRLVLDDPDGASADGTARLHYWGEFPEIALDPAVDSEMTTAQDNACLSFALARFYRKLASNRLLYTRYSTLVGQNGLSTRALQREGDRHFERFLDEEQDATLHLAAPAYYYEG